MYKSKQIVNLLMGEFGLRLLASNEPNFYAQIIKFPIYFCSRNISHYNEVVFENFIPI